MRNKKSIREAAVSPRLFTVYVKDAFAAQQCVKAFPTEQGASAL